MSFGTMRSIALATCAGLAFIPIASADAPQPQSRTLREGLVSLEQNHAEAVARAERLGWNRAQPLDGTDMALIGWAGVPRFFATTNTNSADTIGMDALLPGGSSGLGLTGAGVQLRFWDGGRVLTTHQELGVRATQIDSPGSYSSHATHVAGTMLASGVDAAAKGMAPGATLRCFDFNSDLTEMSAEAPAGALLSNHSYGYVVGWGLVSWDWGDGLGPVTTWLWYGDAWVSPVEDYWFGWYSERSSLIDLLLVENPRYLPVFAASNDRDDTGPAPGGRHLWYNPESGYWLEESNAIRNTDGPWDCLPTGGQTAKNTLVVGSVLDIAGGYTSPPGVVLSAFSSTGPCDDSRIKPDIVANGQSLYSCTAAGNNQYSSMSGTSMAAPSATGALAALRHHWRNLNPGQLELLSSTWKAILIHTADEAGASTGPDAEFGWGLLDAVGAAGLITADATNRWTVQEITINQGASVEKQYRATGGPVRATIVWIDQPGEAPEAGLDDPTSVLVNDLDLRVEIGAARAITLPWRLSAASPASAATRGDNAVDNVERVDPTSAPAIGESVVVTVTHKGSLEGGSQTFSLVITGAAPVCVGDIDGNGTTNAADFNILASHFRQSVTPGTNGDLNGDGIVNALDFNIFASDFRCGT